MESGTPGKVRGGRGWTRAAPYQARPEVDQVGAKTHEELLRRLAANAAADVVCVAGDEGLG
jgi:hypothetical protein